MKFGVCAIIKNENLYLREWVEYYINLGFDKIILYDNNEIDGENPNIVIQDYIDKNIVDIIDKRGNRGVNDGLNYGFNLTPQILSYNECFELYNYKLDWIAFFDIDEFLEINDGKTIQQQFEFMKYDTFDVVCVFWKIYGDNNQFYYVDEPVQKRFLDPSNVKLEVHHPKSICKTNKNIKFTYQPHAPENCQCCSSDKTPLYILKSNCLFLDPFYEHMYLKHYYTKSLTEFLYRKLNWWRYSDKVEEIKKLFDFSIANYKKYNGIWTDKHEKIYIDFYNTHIKKEASN